MSDQSDSNLTTQIAANSVLRNQLLKKEEERARLDGILNDAKVILLRVGVGERDGVELLSADEAIFQLLDLLIPDVN